MEATDTGNWLLHVNQTANEKQFPLQSSTLQTSTTADRRHTNNLTGQKQATLCVEWKKIPLLCDEIRQKR